MPGTLCTVASCKNAKLKTSKNPSLAHIIYHKFPRDERMKKKWATQCGRKGKWKPDNCHVCSEHFKANDYVRDLRSELLTLPPKKRLKKTAVPSLLLGHTHDDDSMPEEDERESNKNIVDELLNRKYDQDEVDNSGHDESFNTDQSFNEYVVEYLEDTGEMLMLKDDDELEECTCNCQNCTSFKNLTLRHQRLQRKYEELENDNDRLCYELNDVKEKLRTLKNKRNQEHTVVQSRGTDGMYELFVVTSMEG